MALPDISIIEKHRRGEKVSEKDLKTKSDKKKKTTKKSKENTSDKSAKIQNFIDFFSSKDGTYAEKFSEMDSNDYRKTGLYMFDHVICKYGMKFPGKILIYGRPHIGKTSFFHALISSYMDRNPEAYVAYLDLDWTVDKEFVENQHKITGPKSDKFVYMRVQSADKAMHMFNKALDEKLFDIIVADPWNMIAIQADVDKDGATSKTQLIGKTKVADRAMINGDFFRTKSHLIDASGVSFMFAEHETSNMSTGTGFAGGSALESSMEIIVQMTKPFKPPVPVWFDKEQGDIVTPVEFYIKKQKLNNNKKQRYYLYFHKDKGYLSEYDKFAFLLHHKKLQQNGAYWKFDHPDLCEIKSFYFKDWEQVVEDNYELIKKACDDLCK